MFEPIFRDAVSGVAGVVIYDKGEQGILGRYCIAKSMKDKRGHFRTTQADCCQRPAAIRRAVKWLKKRAAMAGTTYTPGDGAKTIAFKPLEVKGGAA